MNEHSALPSNTGGSEEGLTVEQEAVVRFDRGPLLVVAGPGSGKTRVITHRIAARIQDGRVAPDRVLAVTFTRAAAAQMRTRITRLVGCDISVHAGTFHWMCSALLRRHIHRLGYNRNFRLLSPAASRSLMAEAWGTLGQQSTASKLYAAMSSVKNGATMHCSAERHEVDVKQLSGIIMRFDQYKQKRSLVDLDDLLALTAQLLRETPEVREACRGLHDDIVVDEFQDINPVQLELLDLLAPSNRNVVAVGDDDQAIYGWRQALPESLMAFDHTFRGSRVLTLRTNFRSSKYILRVANEVIANNTRRFATSMRTDNPAGEQPTCFRASDEEREADWIATMAARIHHRHRVAWHEIAILFRVNSQARVLEEAFLRHDVPYNIQARYRFYDRPEIRHVAAYAHVALNRMNDAAAARLLTDLYGIGAARLEHLRTRVTSHERSISDLLFDEALVEATVPAALRAAVLQLNLHVREIVDLRQSSLPFFVDAAIRLTRIDFMTRGGLGDDGGDDFLAELASMAADAHGQRGTLRSLVDRLDAALEATRASVGVQMLSLHASKGLEFQTVFLCGLEEGILPHRQSLSREDSIEEERRLCYVGITRAQTRLFLSYARTRSISGHLVERKKSRFLDEMATASIRSVRSSPTIAPGLRADVGESATKTMSTGGTAINGSADRPESQSGGLDVLR